MRKRILFLFFCAFCSSNLQAQDVSPECEQRIDDLIDYALDYIGVPYDSAGSTPQGFDCSGFVCYVYSKYGIKLPRHSGDQWKEGEMVLLGEIKRGDLVFFVTRKSNYQTIGHVGIAVSDYDEESENFKFIHAYSSEGRVCISDFRTIYLQNQFGGARRFPICDSSPY